MCICCVTFLLHPPHVASCGERFSSFLWAVVTYVSQTSTRFFKMTSNSWLFIVLQHLMVAWVKQKKEKRLVTGVSWQHFFFSPKCGWWTAVTGVRAGWRCATTTRGERCVMTTGTWWMPMWCVSSWDAGWPWRWAAAPSLDKAQGSSCWIMWTAEELKQTSASATAWAGGSTTVTTTRMWPLPAEVKPLPSLKP